MESNFCINCHMLAILNDKGYCDDCWIEHLLAEEQVYCEEEDDINDGY